MFALVSDFISVSVPVPMPLTEIPLQLHCALYRLKSLVPMIHLYIRS